MTVASIYAPPQYTGNAVTRDFAFTYQFFDPTELQIELWDTSTAMKVSPQPVLNGGATYDYIVTGTKDADTGEYLSGCTVTFNNAPLANHEVTIFRDVQPYQQMALTNNARFPAKTVEGAHDRAILLIQQIWQLFGAVLLTAPDRRAGKLISGDGTLVDGLGRIVQMEFEFDGGGAVLPAALEAYGYCSFPVTITGWVLEAGPAGSISFGVYAKPYVENSMPAIGNSIVAAAPPALVAGSLKKSTLLTGWTTVIPADTAFVAHINSCATITKAKLILLMLRS